MTMCRSDWATGVPFRLASMTRRQASTVTSSPRSLAASRTFQAASSDLSGFDSSEAMPKCSHAAAPSEFAFIVISPPISYRSSLPKKRGLAFDVGIGDRRVLAGLIKFQNAPGRLDVQAAKLAFQVFQVVRSDAVILCAEKKQGHSRVPRRVEGFGQNQQRFAVPVHEGSFDHVARQRAQQGQSDRNLVNPVGASVTGYAVLIQVALPMLRRHDLLCDKMAS